MQAFVRAPAIRREISSSTAIECISVTISCCETFQSTFRFVSKRVSHQQIKFGYDGLLADALRTQKNENLSSSAGPQSIALPAVNKILGSAEMFVTRDRTSAEKFNKLENVVHEGYLETAKTCSLPKHHFRTPPHIQRLCWHWRKVIFSLFSRSVAKIDSQPSLSDEIILFLSKFIRRMSLSAKSKNSAPVSLRIAHRGVRKDLPIR